MMAPQMQAVRPPVELTDLAVLVETSMIQISPQCTITSRHLLQRLDVLRQRLSVRWCGTPGAFAGFDRLDVDGGGGTVTGWVTLSCRMVGAGEAAHTVELVAVLVAADDGSAPRTLVSGTGRTLQVAA